jgi:Kef-type K+ transport system membrane component KefB
MNPIFAQIGTVIILATSLSLLARLFRLPPIVGYILTGIALGPLGTHYLEDTELMEALHQIGTAFLLFLVGLELDWTKARYHLRTVLSLGLAQLIISLFLGFLLAATFGQSNWVGVYLGLTLAFSSTIIVVKLLSEGRELHALHGRLAIGLLILQDIAAIIALTVLNGLAHPTTLALPEVLLLLLIKVFALLSIVWVLTQYILPPLFARLARSTELLFLVSLAWCFAFAVVISRYDLPPEIGAFLAGVSLATLPYSLDMVNRLRSIRDFFVILLFVTIGRKLVLPNPELLWLAGWMLILTVFGKPFFAFLTFIIRGYRSRNAFLAASTQGQVSEFALILTATGLAAGTLSQEVTSTITFVAIFSIFFSTILYSQRLFLYRFLRRPLRWFEKVKWGYHHETPPADTYRDHIIIFGYHRVGYHILKQLRKLGDPAIVVDYNPDVIKRLQEQNIPCQYGDIQDEELLDTVHAQHARIIISTIPHREETLYLLQRLKEVNKDVIAIVTAHHIDDALDFYQAGASYVFMPHVLGGEHIADLITQYEHHSLRTLMRQRQEEIKLLRTKQHALYVD